MILEKINVPIDKQRIIFGAKQLNDDSKVTDYGNILVYIFSQIIWINCTSYC
jgi:hypothetical protein